MFQRVDEVGVGFVSLAHVDSILERPDLRAKPATFADDGALPERVLEASELLRGESVRLEIIEQQLGLRGV